MKNPSPNSGRGSGTELYSYKLESGPQAISIKFKVGTTQMLLSLYKVEGEYKTKNLPNQGLSQKHMIENSNVQSKKALGLQPILNLKERSPERDI